MRHITIIAGRNQSIGEITAELQSSTFRETTMKTRTQVAIASCLGMGLALLPHAAQGQAVYGSVYGTVTDSTGAAIPNATVTVTDEAKGITVSTTSNGSGAYSVDHLIPDLYTVKVEAPGFKGFQTTHLQVLADTSPKVDAPLQTGGASETVNVNADAVPQLKTDRADVATTFDTKTVDDLPIQGRNFTSLQLLLPGAEQLGWGHAASENPQASQQIQIDGQAFGGVAYELDGTDNQDPILGIIVVNPALDAITEAKIATQNFDAEFGKAVSAVVTVQTKSGSNNFHGSAFDYRRSAANLARDPFSQNPGPDNNFKKVVPIGLYNQFGGSLGGPIKKDRAFAFGDYQGNRQKVGTSAIETVPSQLLVNTCLGNQVGPSGIAGCDFSEYAKQAGVANLIYDPATRQPYQGNVIPASQLSPSALNLLRLLQPYAPNRQGTYNFLSDNYAGGGTGLFNSNQWDVRGDVQVNSKTHAFGRFSRFSDTLTGTTLFGAAGGAGLGLGGYGGTSKGANDSVATGADIAINSTLLTDFRLGYYRYNITTQSYNQSVPFAQQLGIPNANTGTSFTGGAPLITLANPFTSAGNFSTAPSANQNTDAQYGTGLQVNHCNCPLAEHEDQYQIVNNWTKVLGNHSVKVGADLRYARNLRVPSDTNRVGSFFFGNGPTSDGGSNGGLGFATFVLGDVTQFNRYVSSSTNAKEFQKRVFFYGQDTWRASSKLTINAGLRWELYFPETVNGKGNGSLMHLNTGYLSVAGYGNIPSNLGWSLSPKALSPRIGVAYQLDPKTVIRAGYGRSFDIGVFGSIFGHVVTQNIPVLANQAVVSPAGQYTAAFNLDAGPPVPAPVNVPANGLLPSPGYAVTSKARPDSLRLPTIDAWNLSVQRSITPSLSLTVAYVGNKGTHTLSAGDGNNTNPNEAGIFLPQQYSINGQTLHYDPSAKNGIVNGGTSNENQLRRYYGGTLPACSDPAYARPAGLPATAQPGACGWTNNISYYGDDQDTHFNALQVTVTKQFTKGLSFTSNYAWQRSVNFSSNFSTWNRQAVKGRDDSQREQQEVFYANYELPFGKNHTFLSGASTLVDEVVGGWQISPVLTWAGGLPFTLGYAECSSAIPSSAPCYVNGHGNDLPHSLGSYDPIGHRRLYFRGSTQKLTDAPFLNFSAPGLDQIGTSGRNSVFGPGYFGTDASLQKNFPIHESLFAQFRVDAYNVFNHINGNNPGGNIDQGNQYVSSIYPSQFPTRQLQFSVRFQF